MPAPRLFLLGGTASGKTAVSLALARRLGGEIINFDALKVYREMDIGTAKPSRADREAVPHHLIDILDPDESYSAGRFVRDACAAEARIRGLPIYAGGTSLYYKARVWGLFEGQPIDPGVRRELRERARREGAPALHAELASVDAPAAARIHPHDQKRILRALEVFHSSGRPLSAQQTQFERGASLPALSIFLARQEADLRARIEARVRDQIAAGLEAEVRALMARPEGWSREAREAVTYREMRAKIEGRLSLEEAVAEIVRRNWRLSRRQHTWVRSLPEVRRLEVFPGEPADSVAARIALLS
jgi:tRNA dimethylallyltransferase